MLKSRNQLGSLGKKQLEIIRIFDRHLRGPCKYLPAGRIRETKDVVLEKRASVMICYKYLLNGRAKRATLRQF